MLPQAVAGDDSYGIGLLRATLCANGYSRFNKQGSWFKVAAVYHMLVVAPLLTMHLSMVIQPKALRVCQVLS